MKCKNVNIFTSSILSFILLLLITCYWVFKNPQWLTFKVIDWSFLTLLFLSFCGLVHLLTYKNHEVGRDELLYVTLLCLVPLPGFISSEIFHMGPAYDWSARIDPSLESGAKNTLFGFRQYIFTGIVFILASRFIALHITRSQFIYILLIAGFIHVAWGVAQFLWPLFPDILAMLPINVGDTCANGEGYCSRVIRATGLTPNPFYFGWLMLVMFLVLLVQKYISFSLFFYLTSYLSLTRTFVLASTPIIIKLLSRYKKFAILLILIAIPVLYASLDDLSTIVGLRSGFEESKESRLQSNLMVLREYFAGNIFGIGWLNGYYTDSTIATILLKSGVLGLVFYISGWSVFYWRLYLYSDKNTYTLYFATFFFIASFFIGSVEAHPGSFILYVFYWQQRRRFYSRQFIKMQTI